MLFTKNHVFLGGLAMFATIVCEEFLLKNLWWYCIQASLRESNTFLDKTTIANIQTKKLFNVEYFKGMKNKWNKQTNKQTKN